MQIVSAFAKEMLQREADRQRTTSWKYAERENSQGLIGPALWGRGGGDNALAPARFLHICKAREERAVYYVLSVGRIVGLFKYYLDEQREIRIFHRQQTAVLGMAYLPQTQHIVLAVMLADGTAHLEVYDEEGTQKGAATVWMQRPPPCRGLKPRWFTNPGGRRVMQTPVLWWALVTAPHWVDYKAGEMDSLLDDEQWDYVAPHISQDKMLFAIRRPTDKPVHEKAGMAVKDSLMMPLRLGKAVFGYLNVFSMLYGKEPLRSAGGPRTPELDQDLGTLWLHGRRIELSRVRTDPEYAGNLVPASWKLIAQAGRHAEPQEIASHVAHFDVLADGSVLLSNGYDIHHWQRGQKRKLVRMELVEGRLAL